MQIVITQKMSFGRPVISPKHYLSSGASGWLETFERVSADKALQTFIGQRSIADFISNFMEHQDLKIEKKKTTWSDITGYLSRLMRIHPEKIPVEVGVAFWANVTMIEDAEGQN